jgi:[lysine-biosynthesis-protein LysW]--L-2-aminoadipate ligase
LRARIGESRGGSRIAITVSMLFDQIRWEEKNLIAVAKEKRINLIPIDARKLHIEVTSRKARKEFGDIALQRCISYFRGLHITAALENMDIPVINSYAVTAVCGNKLLTTLALAKAGVPTPKTILAFTPEMVLEALEEMNYQAVLKPVTGSWGRMIAPLKDREIAEAILEDREYMHPLYQVYYVQEIVKRPPRDIRVTVIGDEAVVAIYRISATGELITNLARGGRAEPCKITKELREISLKAAKAVGGGVLGVDVMESPKGLVVHEVNHTIEFFGTVTTTHIDIPGLILDYAIKQVKNK